MITVNCDGLCEPINPGGTACYGWVAYQNGERIGEGCGVICSGPEATNNVAEYTAVIKALEWLLASQLENEKIEIRSDSQLCIYQLQGIYGVYSPRIKPLYKKARQLAGKFRDLHFRWVPREQNEEADELSRKAYRSTLRENQIDPKRLERARQLISSVKPIGNGLYIVRSQISNKEYKVDLNSGTCSCPDSQKRGIKCKHILAVEIAAGMRT